MATINELGRNSASITYGGTGTGADLWPTFSLVDQWLRNDTLQGTATASSTTVTGVGSIFVTQVRAGDVIMIAGQMRTVASNPTTDTALSVTVAFNPAITVASAIKVINTTLTGTSDTTPVRDNTFGVVSVTKDSKNIVGSNTFFLTDATNSVAAISMAGTVSTTSGANTLTGSGTSFLTGQGTANGLFPGDSITIVSNGVTYFFAVDSVTNDTTAILASNASATVSGGVITKATNGVAGRTININGRIRQIESISTNTLMAVTVPMDFTDSNLRYKVYARGTVANAVSGTLIQATTCSSSGTTLTVGGTLTGVIPIGSVLGLGSGTGTPIAGTVIVDQQFGATGTGIATTTASGSSGANTITVSSATGILVGQLIAGNGATVAGIPNSTYVAAISGTTITLSKNLTGGLSTTSVTFFTPGGTGAYTISQAPSVAYSAATIQFSGIIGTGVNFAWDMVTGDQVWIGEELRTFNFVRDGTGIQNTVAGSPINLAYTTDFFGYAATPVGVIRQVLQGITYRREDSYINGLGTSFATELRVGDDLIIDGTEVTVTQILSATRFRINQDFTHSLSTSSTFYKKKKIHGYVLEGTREGGTTAPAAANLPGTKWSQATTMLATTNQTYPIGTNTLTVASAPTVGLYNFIKISGAGGPSVLLSGTITATGSTLTGTGTSFLTQLHVGTEIYAAGQHLVVTAIASDTSCTVQQTVGAIANPVPFSRTVPLYTFIAAIAGAIITLGHPLRNSIYATASNPAIVYTCNTGGDFIEYVYSCPNKSAEASTILFNTSLDRKYVGFRFYPLMQNATTQSGQVITGYTPTATSTITTALGGWNTPVYERWVAAHGQTNGVGINLADCSGGTVFLGTQPTTTALTLNNPIAGSIVVPATSTQHPPFTASTVGNFVSASPSGTINQGTSTYTVASSLTTTSAVYIGGIGTAFDTQIGSQTTGGFLYLFANPRYFILQGKSFSNVPTNWIGCVEFERAQPEDTGNGLGTTSGVSYNTFSLTSGVGGSQTFQGMGASAVLGNPNISPWPCYGYVNGARFPVGASQYPTLPNAGNAPVHGNVISVPRVRNSATDLVGVNAHIYSALTITTGRWGHQIEFGATGSYVSPGTPSGSAMIAQPVDMIPQIHMGQIVPTFTNVYNAKRFMFSPVVVLGPSYDPDVRGRLYGMKVIPSGLGTLMDTVSITIDSNLFYDATQSATDHWVLSAAVQTYRMTLRQSASQIQQSWRSLEDGGTQATNGVTTYANSFRFALPA